MGTAGPAALVLGKMLDKFGIVVVLGGVAVSSLFAPLVFLGQGGMALAGMVYWGTGIAVQDSLFKALVAGLVPSQRRSTGFGVFDTGFGVAWFLGSAAMGALYDYSIAGVVILSVVLQLAALPVFIYGFAKTPRIHP
jgi:MFS family permease